MAKTVATAQITLTEVTDGEGINISINGGVRGISYAADGSTPSPATSTPFSFELTKNGVSSTPFSYSWSCGGNLSGSSTELTFTPKISTSFVSGDSYVKLEIRETENSALTSQTIPIVSTKFADGLDWIEDWNSTGTLVNDKKIITPRIFAGANEGSNTSPNLTGVAIGLDVLGTTSEAIGIVGYAKNDPRFKLDTKGNFFVGSGWDSISSGDGGGIKYDAELKKLVVSGDMDIIGGSIGSQDIDKILGDIEGSSNTIENWSVESSDGFVAIRGGAIYAGSVTADKLTVNGLTVKDENNISTFSVAQNGEVTIDGTLRSNNFSLLDSTGYQITRDGEAIFNQARIRGTVELPYAGITNTGTEDTSVRLWAGASYENRDLAPFRVFQDGSLIAFNGTFNGNILGDYDNDMVHIRGESIYMDEVKTSFNRATARIETEEPETPPIRYLEFSPSQSFIRADFYLGREEDRDFEYLSSKKQITTQTKNISRTQLGTSVMNYNYESSNKSDYHILNTSGGNGGSHDIRYEKDTGGMIFESDGSNIAERPFDYKFKKNNGDVSVSIEGGVDIKKGITSPKHNIEMRATSTGFAFYLI